MATATKKPPRKTKNLHQRTVALAPEQRFTQRLVYSLKHPVSTLWGWLGSVRTAIFLLIAIVVVCLLGIYFLQAPREVVGDPVLYPAWVQQNALPRYGSLTPLFDWLQFFTIFSSWYFLLLLVLLALSIIVSTVNRAPLIWQNFAHPVLRRPDNFYESALERSVFSHPDPIAWTQAAFRKRQYRVRIASSTALKSDPPIVGAPGLSPRLAPALEPPQNSSPIIYLYANKNSWATLSTFVFHAALVLLLFAGMLTQWHGFAPDSPARRFLPAPLVTLSDSLAGFSFDQPLPDGQSAVVYTRGTPHNISFRANSFTATFDPKTGLPTDYVTDLSVYQDGELVAHSNHVRVNDPLTYKGIVFHQSSLVPAVNITITDKSGYVIYSDAVVLDSIDTLPSGGVVDLARGIPIGGTNLTMSVLFPHAPTLQLAQIPHPRILIAIGTPNAAPNQDKVLVSLSPGDVGHSVDGDWTVRLNSANEATVLLVTKDTGAVLIWPTAVILIVSLCISFYFPQRRIWIRIDRSHNRVQLAALREHFTTIRTDLLSITREAQAGQENH
jgi:cytochrome c biogenesis protein